jgi:hypothetical protein
MLLSVTQASVVTLVGSTNESYPTAGTSLIATQQQEPEWGVRSMTFTPRASQIGMLSES